MRTAIEKLLRDSRVAELHGEVEGSPAARDGVCLRRGGGIAGDLCVDEGRVVDETRHRIAVSQERSVHQRRQSLQHEFIQCKPYLTGEHCNYMNHPSHLRVETVEQFALARTQLSQSVHYDLVLVGQGGPQEQLAHTVAAQAGRQRRRRGISGGEKRPQ